MSSSDFHSSFLKANNLLIQHRPAEAIALYTSLLTSTVDYDLFLNRGIAYLRQNEYLLALSDIEKALELDLSRPEGYYNRGIANFYLTKGKAALNDFQEAGKRNFDQKQIDLWCNKAKLQIKLSGEEKKVEEKTEIKENKENKPDIIREKIVLPSGKSSYIWFQTDKYIGFEFFTKLDKPESFKCKVDETTAEISYPTNDSNEFLINLMLWEDILPETLKINHNLDKIEVKVEKKVKNLNWVRLEKSVKVIGINEVPDIEKAPAYPSSSKYKKDWSKLEQEIEAEINKEKEGDPLNSLFKNIYGNADEETKRAMIKSYQTSGGTVLSTNWKEVQEKDYEGKDRPEAPKGQEWANKK